MINCPESTPQAAVYIWKEQVQNELEVKRNIVVHIQYPNPQQTLLYFQYTVNNDHHHSSHI